MPMDVITIPQDQSWPQAAQAGIERLSSGGLVAFPTETVYGLGARADLPEAMARLRHVKGRSTDQAFTLHVGHPDDAKRYVNHLPAVAERITRKAWPGPLTLILEVSEPDGTPAMAGVAPGTVEALYFDKTIGIRCPQDKVATAILTGVDGPVVAASANAAGSPPPRSGSEAVTALAGLGADLLLSGGTTKYEKASTIVAIGDNGFEIKREGVLDRRIMEKLATLRLLFVCTGNTCRSPMAEGLAKRWLANKLNCSIDQLGDQYIVVVSAGTAGGFGSASVSSVQVMARRGIDISGHVSRPLTVEEVNLADAIFVMTRSHLDAVTTLVPDAADRVALLIHDDDVPDPIGGTEADYESCAVRIEKGIEDRLKEVEI
ncbi:MAG: L-threonylcarbamoyladenylate synthase [Planctomycetota bacterium]|jgi:protein-tyrosine phosphatase